MDSFADIGPVVEIDSIYGSIRTFDDDLITHQIRAHGGHTRPEFAFATSIMTPHEQVFDIGAHIGTFSLLTARKTGPAARILAVEGNSATRALLDANTAHSSGIETCNAFVSDGEGQYDYVADDDNTGGGFLVGGSGTSTVTIDSLALRFFEPTYVKIDIEGLEMTALGCSELIRDRRPTIYVEIGRKALGRNGCHPEALVGFLRGLGYEMYVNVGERNAPHDIFEIARLPRSWVSGKSMFDVLCVRKGSREDDILAARTGLRKGVSRMLRSFAPAYGGRP